MAVVEIERRVILFKSTTTLPDDSQLGWNADPNTVVNGNSAGETLLYNSPLGTQYIEDDGTHWRKTATPNTWTESGSGGGSGTGAGTITGQNTNSCTLGSLVYLSGVATWSDLSVHSDATLGKAIGVCTAVDASAGTVVTKGEYTSSSHGLTAGAELWANPSDTDGWTTTQPDTDGQFLKKIGWVLDADTLWIDVEEEYSELGDAVWTDDHATLSDNLAWDTSGHTKGATNKTAVATGDIIAMWDSENSDAPINVLVTVGYSF